MPSLSSRKATLINYHCLPTKVMLETAAACPPGLVAVHMYRPESDTADDSKLILLSLTIKRSASDPVIVVKPFTQPTLGSGNPVTSQVRVIGVPVSAVT